MALRRMIRMLALAVALAILLTSAAPAVASSGPNTPPPLPGVPQPKPNPDPAPLPGRTDLVPANVSVAGHDLGGLTEDQARSAIHAYVKPADLPPLTAVAAGKTYTLAASAAFHLDSDAMLAEAFRANGVDPVELSPRFRCDSRAARSFVSYIAAKTNRTGADARWYVSAKRLKLRPSAVGQTTDKNAAYWGVLDAMKAEARTGLRQPAVAIPVKTVAPLVTEKKLGRAILVVLSERYLRLYDPANGGYQLHGYDCAVGQPAWPTPTGNFKIVEKRYMPTWVNPGSSWGSGMPPYIGPGPGNPLGTRALNLNADGIRIHGTENIGSIGTAASHGCIRLVRKNIEQLYDLVVVGTPVFIIK